MAASSCPVTPAKEQSKSNPDQEKSSSSPGRKKFLGRMARGKSPSSMPSIKQKSKHSKTSKQLNTELNKNYNAEHGQNPMTCGSQGKAGAGPAAGRRRRRVAAEVKTRPL